MNLKIIGVSGSPRHANTEVMVKHALEAAKSIETPEVSVETQFISLAQKNVRGCLNCRGCVRTGKCVLKDAWDELFRPLYNSLLNTQCTPKADTYFILKDFKPYAEAQKKVEAAYRDEAGWARSAILNVACSGKFTSDRTIQQYVDEIWHLDKVVLK